MAQGSQKTHATTLQEVASAAGVTLATASRSMNGAYGVHPETKRRVLEIAERLNYRPNRFARGLVTGRSNVIGLIVSDVRNAYFAEVARGAEDAAYSAGLDLLLCNSDLNGEKQMRYIRSLLEKRVDGIIMNSVASLPAADQQYLAESGVPVVLLNRPGKTGPFSTVSPDNERGGQLAAEYLLNMGHRKIVHMTGPRDHTNLAERALGLKQALSRSTLGAELTIIHGTHTLAGGYTMAKALFRDLGEVTAISTANDAVALGVIKAALECEISIPRDVSLIGFDDIEVAALTQPPLTTIRQAKYEIGAASVDVLLRLSGGKERTAEHRVLGVELIERASVAKLSPPQAKKGDKGRKSNASR